MNCLPLITTALQRWFTSAAYRPAGTREALPGTIWRNSRSAFSSYWHGKRRAGVPKKFVVKKFFSRTEASA
jgi:hypothetical protein